MRRLALLIICFLSGEMYASSPSISVSMACADARRLPPDIAKRTRYLSNYHFSEKENKEFDKLLTFHVNSLSREPDLVYPRIVAPGLYAIILDDYGWSDKVWEKLGANDAYYHVLVDSEITETIWVDQEYGYYQGPGKTNWITTKTVKEKKEIKKKVKKADALAPWLNPVDSTELATLTQSNCPIVRADWFFYWTAIPFERNGSGYYDFLAIKKRDDIFDVVGIDIVKVKKAKQEIAAIIAESGVTLNARQIFRFGNRAYWTSLDAAQGKGKSNAVRLLDGDFKHDAEEIYFFLPNGLFGTAASNVKGELQNSVPDTIASDGASTSNDRKIYPGLSCIRCHVEGLRPLADWGRKFYTPDTPLQSPDYAKLRRLRQLYLRPLEDDYEDDNRIYARTLFRLNGWKPADAARAYAEAWHKYLETPLSGEQLAAELGVTHERMLSAFAAYAKGGGQLDIVLVGYLKRPEMRARREFIEEVFPHAMSVVYGLK